MFTFSEVKDINRTLNKEYEKVSQRGKSNYKDKSSNKQSQNNGKQI